MKPLFPNLDEDFGNLFSMVGCLKKRLGYDTTEVNCEDSPEKWIEEYGPFNEQELVTDTWVEYFILIMEFSCYLFAFVTPFVYFACSL